jgi:glutaredoxin 3
VEHTHREQTKRVKIYTTPACHWCSVAKQFFAEHGIAYTEVDVMTDRNGLREMLVATGQHAVPVVMVGEKAMVGWCADEFRAMMGLPASRPPWAYSGGSEAGTAAAASDDALGTGANLM